ncbi:MULTISPECIES: hypothetical protein [Xanthomonas]|uniref:hypothetical protein n=1 Tax=Xanthomonas TaxID=338 RepID=UPI000F8ED2F0|nr:MULTISPECIES: hypothetical protein [Xanthomonas]UXA53386.1 hypothetical protein M0D45_00835 [Xanthomonas prunicola]
MALDPIALKSLALELAAAMPPAEPPSDVNFKPIDISPRARAMRRILRIADMHGWHDAIVVFLEMKGAEHLFDLTQLQLDELSERMNAYVDAAEIGASAADCLPAG